MGHDGPGHVAIAQEQPTLRALKLYHGKRGAGLSVEFKVRYGPVTIVGCTQTADGRLKLAAGRGRVDPRRDVPDRQHEQPAALRAAAGRVLRALVRARARRTTSRSASAMSPARCASGVAARARARGGRLRWSASASCCACGPIAWTNTGAPSRGVAGDARRAALDRLGQLLALPRRRRAAGRLPRDRGLRGGASPAWRRPTSTPAGRRRWPSSSSCPRASARHGAAPPRGGLPPCLRRYAAIDLGATSGRVVAGRLEGERMALEEVHRFHNRPVRLPDGLRWNLLHLFTEALEGLRRAGPLRRRRRRHLGRRLRAARRRRPRARPAVPLPRRAHRGDGRARVRPRPAGRALRDHRHPDAADQHRLPAARRRGLGRARRRGAARARPRPARATGSAASWPTSPPTRRRPGCSTRAAASGRAS